MVLIPFFLLNKVENGKVLGIELFIQKNTNVKLVFG